MRHQMEGRVHSAIPTLHSSFVVGQQECKFWVGKERKGVAVTLVHSLTDTALAQLRKARPCPCALTAGGLNSSPTLPYQKP
ncbi:hypothetical protein VZT92_009841 [Zoarces viviparus]|uniref:Uncharacterized protein n=1 Tax=Zoarces viviparus TaxID=48416 RepID=A0AAW1FCR3_ZOAVI